MEKELKKFVVKQIDKFVSVEQITKEGLKLLESGEFDTEKKAKDTFRLIVSRIERNRYSSFDTIQYRKDMKSNKTEEEKEERRERRRERNKKRRKALADLKYKRETKMFGGG